MTDSELWVYSIHVGLAVGVTVALLLCVVLGMAFVKLLLR